MSDMVSFNVTYDRGSDVLYINTRHEAATKTKTDDYGIYWRYDAHDRIIGATVIDFADYWFEHRKTLETALSRRFDVPTYRMRTILDHAAKK